MFENWFSFLALCSKGLSKNFLVPWLPFQNQWHLEPRSTTQVFICSDWSKRSINFFWSISYHFYCKTKRVLCPSSSSEFTLPNCWSKWNPMMISSRKLFLLYLKAFKFFLKLSWFFSNFLTLLMVVLILCTY